MLKLRISNDALNTGDKGHYKFNVNKTLNYVDYKPSKLIRNIRRLHTCKNLNSNVSYLFKRYHTCTYFQNSSEKLRETDFDR